MKNGRSSLKVRVKNQHGQARFTLQKRGGAPYVYGYAVNGNYETLKANFSNISLTSSCTCIQVAPLISGVVKLNPSKLPVSEESLVIGSFTRIATGESFEVVLKSTTPPNVPPNRITDLSAEVQEDTVLLSWTAPGEDLDQGTGKSYN